TQTYQKQESCCSFSFRTVCLACRLQYSQPKRKHPAALSKRKARILKEVQAAQTDEKEYLGVALSGPPDLAEAWGLLCVNGAAPDDMQLCDFLYVDGCAVTTEEMSDEALVESIRCQTDDDRSPEVESPCAMTLYSYIVYSF
ncbi:hypothetical protein V5799_015929, partial [Amblyomma americanum]